MTTAQPQGSRMHADEVGIDADLVRALVAEQFPRWAHLPVTEVPSAGTDNAMYRLGGELAVRLPRIPGAVGQVEKEHRLLPRLAGRLPLSVPVPVERGVPGEGYAFPWSVYRWLEGENLIDAPAADPYGTAVALGGFVAALRQVDATGVPRSFRGGPLGGRDRDVRAAIADLGADGTVDGAAATAVWEESLALPQWEGDPVWVHADLLPGNLLAHRGRLSAVIDFGGAGSGDPACDLMPAWTLLSAGTRQAFRDAAAPDAATWLRGRGWALCFGLTAVHYYRGGRNPVLAEVARRTLTEILP
ncbi:aminoglycoside phosphotransferase family protein [Streptomyces sp. NPDC048603]|uniref:aminoglycoside phosphotransferase family protein n=1 Tax=Streptomyces sp. NPDC048603 TaxID=3365577 RepID=UPI0037204787